LADRWAGFNPQAVLPRLEESQHWPRERLELLQLDSLRRLLAHAGAHVPFYRDLFAKLAFDPAGVRSLDDIRQLPVLDKAQLMAEGDRFVSEVARQPRVRLKTSGSTGQPFSFVRTRIAQSYKIASRLRFRRWYGIERTDPQLIVAGIPSLRVSWKQDVQHWIHYVATNRVESYASEMHGDGLERAVRQIERHRVTSVMGYPTGIADLADHIGQRRPLEHPPHAIFTNSETLSDGLRRRIESGFGIRPRSDYVASEGAIAHECPSGGLHVDMEETLLEIVPIPETPDVGTTVLTFLHTFDFPLIRYRIGDVARWAAVPCPCGRGLVTLDGLVGRYADGIRLPDGRFFTAANINMRIAHLPLVAGFRQYQIAQIGPATIELRLQADDAAGTSEAVEQFVTALHDIFGAMSIVPVRLTELPREKNGKFRPVLGWTRDTVVSR
jgi:phenylacetate-CoA ligase